MSGQGSRKLVTSCSNAMILHVTTIILSVSAIATISVLAIASTDVHASSDLRLIDVKLDNKTHALYFNMSNGGSIVNASASTYLLYPDHPRLGLLTINVTSPSEGDLDVIFSRELYDVLSFADHPPNVSVDNMGTPTSASASSCDQIQMRIPLKRGSENVNISAPDILGEHDHPHPPRLEVSMTLVEGGEEFVVVVQTDAIRCDLSLVKEEKKIHIDVAAINDTAVTQGFFSITIPQRLLGGNYTVLADGEQLTPYGSPSFYSSPLVFNYPKDAKTIDVIGETVIPEFGLLTFLALAPGIAAAAIILKIANRAKTK